MAIVGADMLYAVVMINGKMVVFPADEVESTDEKYIFMIDGEVVGEFERKNIAGYFKEDIGDEEEYDS